MMMMREGEGAVCFERQGVWKQRQEEGGGGGQPMARGLMRCK